MQKFLMATDGMEISTKLRMAWFDYEMIAKLTGIHVKHHTEKHVLATIGWSIVRQSEYIWGMK